MARRPRVRFSVMNSRGVRDRLAGKILVIWQFGARELAFGNWKLLDMSLRQPSHARFFTPQAGE